MRGYPRIRTRAWSAVGVVTTLLLFSTGEALAERSTNALLVLEPGQWSTPRQARQVLSAGGVEARHFFWPGVVYAYVPDGMDRTIRALAGVAEIHRSRVPDGFASGRTGIEASAIRIWNSSFADGLAGERLAAPAHSFEPRSAPARVPPMPDGPAPAPRRGADSLPYGADFYDTSEFLIGMVAVGVVLVESNGVVDPDTESWTQAEEDFVFSAVVAGCDFLVARTFVDLSFVYDYHDSVMTDYEPISHPLSGESLWIPQAIASLGYNDPDYFVANRTYLNDLRDTFATDWAFVTYQVDASNDPDGVFADGWGGWSYFGGPHNIVAYDDDAGAIAHFILCAHEFVHNFYALDEYASAQVPCDQRAGYLNWDNENSDYPAGQCPLNVNCFMDNYTTFACRATRRQVGWWDPDDDDIAIILDTYPETTLDSPTVDGATATCTGTATVVPLANQNPFGQGHDITLNRIAAVEWRVDGGTWFPAAPTDGLFGSAQEAFEFTTAPLAGGSHLVEVRAVNSVGNADSTFASDTFDIVATAAPLVGPGAVSLVATPNPFRSSVEIRYSVPEGAGDAMVTIHDVTGRVVWQQRQSGEPVERRLEWDGSGPSGSPTGAGVYFVTLAAGERRATTRIVKLR